MKRLTLLLLIPLAAACNSNKGSGSAPPLEVSVVTLESQAVTLSSGLPGRTSAFKMAEIRPQVSGLILKRSFIEGSDVKIGQVLYKLDPAPFQAALDNARAALGRAQANLPPLKAKAQRFKELLEDKAVSQQDYDDAYAAFKQMEADVASWKAQVESARINLSYTEIRAPISGRIGKSSVTDGAIVTAYQAQPLTTIQQLDPIYVDAPQSTADLLRLRQRLEGGGLKVDNDRKVRLVLEDGAAYPQEGIFQFRDVSVDAGTGSVVLRMVFPNPDKVLLPGMFVRAEVKEGVVDQAILAPQQGIMRNPKGEPYAYIVDGSGKVQMRKLTLDREIGDKYLVASGLAQGDRVVVEGVQKLQLLRPGADVTVKAAPVAEKPPAPASAVPTTPANGK